MKWATGERYNLTKKAHGAPVGNDRAEKQKGNNCTSVPKPPNTAKAIGDMAGVSERAAKSATVGIVPDKLGDGTRHPRLA